MINENMLESEFIDCLGNQCKFKLCSLKDYLSHAQNQLDMFESKPYIINLMCKLMEGNDEKLADKDLIQDLFSTSSVVTSCPRPKHKQKFLYHMLMCFGSFGC